MRKISHRDTERYGAVGSPIEGSVYVRDYCRYCCEPMRVRRDEAGELHTCGYCTLRPQTGGPSGPMDADSGGFSANARMQLEDG
jgi:hypothetical protein